MNPAKDKSFVLSSNGDLVPLAEVQKLQDSRRAALNLMEDAVRSREAMEGLNTELRESEERNRTLFELAPVAVYACDTAGVIQRFNRRAAELWDREPAPGDTDERFCGSFKLFRPDGTFMPHDQCPMAEVVAGKIAEVSDGEVLIERPDGSRVTVIVNIRPLKNASGKILGAINCFYDITERKRSEMAIASLAAIVQSSDDAIIGKDLNSVVTSWNKGAERLFGYTAQEAIGQNITMLIPADRRQEEPEILAKIKRGESIEHFDTVRLRKDGAPLEISLTISPIKDSAGRVIGASKIARDITERRAAEAALAKRAAQQRALYQLAAQANRAQTFAEICDPALEAIRGALPCDRAAILLADGEGIMRFVAWSGLSDGYRAAVEGHSPSRLEDRNPKPLHISNVAEALMDEHLRRVVEREGIASLAFIPLRHQERLIGKFMVYWNKPNPFGSEEMQLCQTIATTVAWAIERKRGEEGLERLVKERTTALRETVGELEAFSYSVAHDLRAPLRAMHGFASLLLQESRAKLNSEEQGHLERIARSATRLDGLIQDVLNYTRIMRGDAPLSRIDLDQLVRDVIHSYGVFQTAKAEVTVAGTLPPVLGNSALLTQCASNLVSNAVKFVAPGTRPRVRIWAETITPPPTPEGGEGEDESAALPPDAAWVRILVQDNGIGIAPHNHPRIFQMFERLHPAAEFEGTGIGLTIVRKAVQRMGGQAGFTSEPGKGSTFWMDLRGI